MYNLFLDDIRTPEMVYKKSKKEWLTVNNYDDFTEVIYKKGLPKIISFDHDLGDVGGFEPERTGYDALKWLCEYCLDCEERLPLIKFHTDNIVGLDNMETYLGNFLKQYPGLKNKK